MRSSNLPNLPIYFFRCPLRLMCSVYLPLDFSEADNPSPEYSFHPHSEQHMLVINFVLKSLNANWEPAIDNYQWMPLGCVRGF